MDVDTAVEPEEDVLYNGNAKSVEYYRERIKTLDRAQYKKTNYAKGTLRLMQASEEEWKMFSKEVLEQDDWKQAMSKLDFETVESFLDFYLHQRKGKNGRRRLGIGKKDSLTTFWCSFRLAFEQTMSFKIDELIDRRLVGNAIEQFSQRLKLSTEKRPNRSMTIADLNTMMRGILETTGKSFKLGIVRLEVALALLLMAPAGSRPGSMLHLRFGDIRLILVRDTKKGGPNKLLIEFTLSFTKRYLGAKAQKTFLLPEILYSSSLFLSPHIFLLAILFNQRAFEVQEMNDPRKFAQLDVFPGEQELLIPLRQDLNDVYVFRRPQASANGYVLSDKPWLLTTLGEAIKRVGELIGFEEPTIMYSLRYMAGNKMDRSIDVSTSLRNLVMDHAPSSNTFQKHYLNRHVCADLMAIHQGLEPQQDLMEQATSHGHSISTRRPADLSPAQKAAVMAQPKIVAWKAKLAAMPQGNKAYKDARLEYRSYVGTAMRKEKARVRSEWTREQAVQDIRRQLTGKGFVEEPAPPRPMSPAHKRLVDAFLLPMVTDRGPEGNLEAYYARRNVVIHEAMAYCNVQEPKVGKLMESKPPPPCPELQRANWIAELRASVTVSEKGQRLRRCFWCVADAIRLPLDDVNIPEKCRTFSGNKEISRHFEQNHVRLIGKNQQTTCPICIPQVTLVHRMHLQNHADTRHGIRSNNLP
ncbi:C2H2 finger domain protein [Xylaria longipes]|nr:C2H2 finger domain protein [Xylaria longipes]